jgi:hypothetical protein
MLSTMGAVPRLSESDAIAPFTTAKEHVRPTTMFRSTWLTSSLRALRDRKLEKAYFAKLPAKYHASVANSVAGVWLPLEVAEAHYAACDALQLPLSDILEIGKTVTRFAHKTSYSFALRLVTDVGVTPWACFAIQRRLWNQVWVGGDVATFKLGPKEARVEVAGWPCARFAYCRIAIRGVLIGQTELFCTKAYAYEIPSQCTPTSLAYRVAWA